MKKIKGVLFAVGAAVVLGVTVFFGYLGFKGEKIGTTMKLSYTDEIVVEDGIPCINYSGVEFINEECDKCRMRVKWGNIEDDYTFISMVKVIAPSGEIATFVTGDIADSVLIFDLEEKGTYRIESEYYFDGYEFCEEVHKLYPEGDTLEVAEDGTVDGFTFGGHDGSWSQSYEIKIITSK